jgi:hypothetical protein
VSSATTHDMRSDPGFERVEVNVVDVARLRGETRGRTCS